MEAKRRRHSIRDRRSRLKLGAREKTAARKIFLLKMAFDAQPVFCALHQEYRILDGFQFEVVRPTGARRGQNVQDPVFTNGLEQASSSTGSCTEVF